MELTAALEALKLLKYPCEVDLYSDSAYLVNGFVKDGFITGTKTIGKIKQRTSKKQRNMGSNI